MKNRVILLFMVLLIASGRAFVTLAETPFLDVGPEHPYATAINYVRAEGIVNGYPDGTFQPDRLLNRAEFTKIIMASQFSALEIDSCMTRQEFYKKKLFDDIEQQIWYEKYACLGKKKTILKGYADGNFRGIQSINFAEASKILTASYGFDIAPGEPWYKPYLDRLEQSQAVPPSLMKIQDLTQRGMKEITRGEMAEIIFRLRTHTNTVSSSDNSLVLSIPDTSLPPGIKREDITIRKLEGEERPLEEINGAPMIFYDLQPDGIQFRQPISFEITTPTLSNIIPIVFLVSEGDVEMLPQPLISLNDSRRTASLAGEITHFSALAISSVNLFELNVSHIYDQEVGISFPVGIQLHRNDVQRKYYHASTDTTITILEDWSLYSGVYHVKEGNILPAVISDAPVRENRSGPLTFALSREFTCQSPSLFSRISYQTGVQLSYEKSNPQEQQRFVSEASVSSETNTFRCLDQTPLLRSSLADPSELECPDAEYLAEDKGGIAVNVLKLPNGKCFPEPDLQMLFSITSVKCPDPHYPSRTVYDLANNEYESSGSSPCGYGKVSESRRGTIFVSPGQNEDLFICQPDQLEIIETL